MAGWETLLLRGAQGLSSQAKERQKEDVDVSGRSRPSGQEKDEEEKEEVAG